METIGERILKLRKMKNYTQRELADIVGITEASLSRYENNKREPKSEIVSRLALALDISSDYLLGRKSEISTFTNDISNLDPEVKKLLKMISTLSEESKKDLEKHIELLKIRDSMESTDNETSSTLEKHA